MSETKGMHCFSTFSGISIYRISSVKSVVMLRNVTRSLAQSIKCVWNGKQLLGSGDNQQSLVAPQLWEELIQSAVACWHWCMSERAPRSSFVQRWEHVTASGGASAVVQCEVAGAVCIIDIHSVVCEGLIELRARRGVCSAVAWTCTDRVGCDLLWEAEVVEVEAIVAKLIRRDAFVEDAAIKLQA